MEIRSSFASLYLTFGCLLACVGDTGDGTSVSTVEGNGTGDTSGDGDGDGGEDDRLFDEAGVWTLQSYALDGGPYTEIAQNRQNRFLLRFKPEDGVVAASACHEQDTAVDVDASNCTNAALSTWTCQCFAYSCAGSTMLWREFQPGDIPPPVGSPATGAHELLVAAPVSAPFKYEFSALPEGLFNSDGEVSKHIFEQKMEAVWTEIDLNQDSVPDLASCSSACFPSGA